MQLYGRRHSSQAGVHGGQCLRGRAGVDVVHRQVALCRDKPGGVVDLRGLAAQPGIGEVADPLAGHAGQGLVYHVAGAGNPGEDGGRGVGRQPPLPPGRAQHRQLILAELREPATGQRAVAHRAGQQVAVVVLAGRRYQRERHPREQRQDLPPPVERRPDVVLLAQDRHHDVHRRLRALPRLRHGSAPGEMGHRLRELPGAGTVPSRQHQRGDPRGSAGRPAGGALTSGHQTRPPSPPAGTAGTPRRGAPAGSPRQGLAGPAKCRMAAPGSSASSIASGEYGSASSCR